MKLRCDDEWDEHPLMRAAKWIVPTVIWLLGMWMVAIGHGREAVRGGEGK